MSDFTTDTPTLTQARQLLDTFSCAEVKTVQSSQEKEQLQNALLLMVKESEAENLGICADNAYQGYTALSHYLTAFGYTIPFKLEEISPVETPVYIKFNTATLSHYLTDYEEGNYRGVLVACQAEDDLVNGVYGHLPLDLFD
ncbi:DUF1824 family protein [Spirulina sp. CS-785/01]|uniref:DUF1824 family protein n=1 Tax=Spirulina sp. CS-785/01 TaxID=3021716 RepID=UPI00232FB5C7|nr:DUF1824 family protein [Spirulina sp. CS-785/01]MDB9313430.1 DUF1824 family protein [Spirulina sp. CS-785/01]